MQAKGRALSAQQRISISTDEDNGMLMTGASTRLDLHAHENRLRNLLEESIGVIKKQQGFKTMGLSAKLCSSQEESVLKCYEAVENSGKGSVAYLDCHDFLRAYRSCAAEVSK